MSFLKLGYQKIVTSVLLTLFSLSLSIGHSEGSLLPCYELLHGEAPVIKN